MTTEVYSFQQLTTPILYACLQLRNEVFIVEQNCVYQDIDDNDAKALHVLGWKDNILVAYARIFPAGDYFDEASIGRVLVRENFRNKGYAHQIMRAAIDAVFAVFGSQMIVISAQTYLIDFYAQHDFIPVGDSYLEDGIPHIKMHRIQED